MNEQHVPSLEAVFESQGSAVLHRVLGPENVSSDRLLASCPHAIGTTADHTRNENTDRLLTIDDVAKWLRVSKAWVYDHTTRKKPFLPCIRIGEITRFHRSEIESFIQEHAQTQWPSLK